MFPRIKAMTCLYNSRRWWWILFDALESCLYEKDDYLASGELQATSPKHQPIIG